MEIAASIASGDLARLAETAGAAQTAGADRIHLDIEDGVLVPTFTVGPAVVASIRHAVRLPLDVHLQTVDPDRWIRVIAEGRPDRVIVQVEGIRDPRHTLELIKGAGMSAGLALFLATPAEAVTELLDCVDHVTVMSADPSPGTFSAGALDKLRALAGHVPAVMVDGGVTPEVLPAAARAGATVAIVGRALFAGGVAGIVEAMAAFRAVERGAPFRTVR
jgi:ribulose-phosphate 3-epimerase